MMWLTTLIAPRKQLITTVMTNSSHSNGVIGSVDVEGLVDACNNPERGGG